MAQLLSFTGGKDYVIHNGEQVKAIFFYDADAPYGFLGNWYRSSFQVDGVEYTSMEQYLMERKCLLFGDQQSAERIMATDIPENQMAIGRTAKGYMDTIWAGRRQAIAMRGLYAKFSQNPALTKQLLDTGDAWLVRCSALDTTWAIGIAINKEERRETAKWRGTNLLGFALMEVREMLRSSCSWSDETAEVEVADQTMISIPTAALPVEVVNGDITKLNVDCIVNAANHSLLGGGGVDGAIHRAAGPGLLKECITLGGCRTGEAKITAGYKLPAKWVIHTVGPVYNADPEDPKQLADCYKNSLDLARSRNLHSIAFPAISTGVYGYPLEEAAKVAADTVRWWLETNADYEMRVIFCCFGTHSTEVYQKALDA